MDEKLKDGGPAFPRFMVSSEPGQPSIILAQTQGMTLRDMFAGMAMMGCESNVTSPDVARISFARACYRMADAMLEAREAVGPLAKP